MDREVQEQMVRASKSGDEANRASASSRGEATFALFMGMLPQHDWLRHVAMPSMRYESFTIIHDGIESSTTHHIVVLFYTLVCSIKLNFLPQHTFRSQVILKHQFQRLILIRSDMHRLAKGGQCFQTDAGMSQMDRPPTVDPEHEKLAVIVPVAGCQTSYSTSRPRRLLQ